MSDHDLDGDRSGRPTRRRALLAAVAGGLASTAGCLGDGGSGGDTDPTGGDTDSAGDGGTDSASDGDTDPTEGGEGNGASDTGTGSDGDATTTVSRESIRTWPTVQYDAGHSGYVAGGIAPTTGATERWSTALTGETSNPNTTVRVHGSPVVADGTVYLPGPDPGIADGPVHGFFALSAADGSERWSVSESNRPFGAPVVADGTVYVAEAMREYSDEMRLFALSAADGSERWVVETRNGGGPPTPVLQDGAVVLPRAINAASRLTAYETADGSERWSVDVPALGALSAAEGRILFATGDLIAYDVADGSRQWSTSFEGGPVFSPAVADGTVYVAFDSAAGSGRPQVHALAAADGSERWSTTLPDGGVRVAASPAVGADAVYVQTDGGLYAVDRSDGSDRWAFGDATYERPTLPDGTVGDAAPVVVGDTVYAHGSDGRQYAVAAADGSERWSSGVGRTKSTPAVAEDTLYVGGTEAKLYALTEP